MKFLTLTVSAALLAASHSRVPAALEVHEWGTFTVLHGSDGYAMEWYQAPVDSPELPAFATGARPAVQLTKARNWQFATLRMETPVLYFYPDQSMKVEVTAALVNGEITEKFPPVAPAREGEPGNLVRWTGALLPPDAPERALVPEASGKAGRHYAAARAVPEAWLFRGDYPVLLPASAAAGDAPPPEPAVAPVEHFIFYRGAGSQAPPLLNVRAGEGGTWTVSNPHPTAIPALLGVRVSGGRVSWQDPGPLAGREDGEMPGISLTFPGPPVPVETAVPALRRIMTGKLEGQGLTPAEAAAMVATWDDLWFTEPGTRLFSLVPREYADALVPLTVSPAPDKLTRVFVQRSELLEPARENALALLLSDPALPAESAAQQLRALELGRFAAGAVRRATAVQAGLMQAKFEALAAQ